MPKYLDGAGLSHFWESIKPKLGGVAQSGSGTVVSSDDAANLPPLSLTIHGKSVQDGTPSPSSPVAIKSVDSPNIFDQTAVAGAIRQGTSNASYAYWSDDVLTNVRSIGSHGYWAFDYPMESPVGAGEVLFVSFDVKLSGTNATQQVRVMLQASDSSTAFTNNAYVEVAAKDTWEHFAVVRTVAAGFSAGDTCYLLIEAGNGGNSVQVRNVCLSASNIGYVPYGSIAARVDGSNIIEVGRDLLTAYYINTAGKKSVDSTGLVSAVNTSSDGRSFIYANSDFFLELPAGSYTFSWFVGTASTNTSCQIAIRNSANTLLNGKSGADTFSANGSIPFTLSEQTKVGIEFKLYTATARFMLTRGTDVPTEYEPYQGTVTNIDLQGHALRSLPNGTEDTLEVDGEGNVTLTKRIGLTTTATTDGISATVGTDAMSTTGTLADGATVIYKLAEPQTISLGKIDLPSLPSPYFSLHVDALVTPTLDAEWWTQGGEEVGSVYQRTSALEQDVDGLTLELSEKVDSSEEWVSWLHAGTDATTHEPYLAMGKDSDYPSVVYGSDAARFYDGEGDAASNVVASFGTEGVVVGKDGSANTAISDSEIVFHDADGNEAGKISMSSEGAVPASASHTITAGDSQQTYTLEGLTPLPDFTLGSLVVDLFYNGTLLHKYIYTSFTGAEFAVSIDTYTDATFTAAQSGDTWGATLTAQHRVVGETADFTFSLKWVYRGTAPMYEFGTAENTGAYSFSAGTGLVAAGQSQAVFGTYNEPSETDLFIVGNGTSDEGRSNALKVDSQGTLETSGYFQLGGNVGLGTVAQEGWLTALGAPFLRFAEVTTATQSIPSGSIAYYDVAAPTYTGFTLRGAIQAWTSGSGTVIIGASYRSSADNYMHFVVRANNSASVAVKALLLYTRDAITFTS